MIGRLLPVIIFLALGILLAFGLKIADHKTEIPSPLIGKQMPTFTLPVLGQEETMVSDQDLLGKPFLINVWASWSGPSIEQLAEFVTANRMYRKREFEMITISADSPSRRDSVLSLLKKQQASCRNYLFDSQDQYQLMAALDKDLLGGVPYTILIKPGGEIIYRQLGPGDPLELKRAIVGYLGRYYK